MCFGASTEIGSSFRRRKRASALVGRCAREDGRAELIHQAEVVTMIPDLHDFAVVAEPEDVHTRELGALTGRRKITPAPGVGAGSGPASCDEVSLTENEVDPPLEIGERLAKLLGDPRLSGSSWSRLRRAKIVAHVVVREDLCREVDVPARPDFFVEPLDQLLVCIHVHRLRDPNPAVPRQTPPPVKRDIEFRSVSQAVV
jgi:hypothetical protein